MTEQLNSLELHDLFRQCADIGMLSTVRPISFSCVHKTDFCGTTCYNFKLYKMYPKMYDREERSEIIWQKLNRHNSDFTKFFSRKRKQTERIRLMNRGEALKDTKDVFRVKTICLLNPDQLWWVPTRAWRNPRLKLLIEKELMTLANCAVNASFDPSNTDAEWKMMQDSDWNIMFYGDDNMLNAPVYNKKMFKCPKTWKKMKGHCDTCKAGCFAQKTIGRTQIVHLSQH